MDTETLKIMIILIIFAFLGIAFIALFTIAIIKWSERNKRIEKNIQIIADNIKSQNKTV